MAHSVREPYATCAFPRLNRRDLIDKPTPTPRIPQTGSGMDDPPGVELLDQRDLMSIAKGVRDRSRPALPRTFVLFAANVPRLIPIRDQPTAKIPRLA